MIGKSGAQSPPPLSCKHLIPPNLRPIEGSHRLDRHTLSLSTSISLPPGWARSLFKLLQEEEAWRGRGCEAPGEGHPIWFRQSRFRLLMSGKIQVMRLNHAILIMAMVESGNLHPGRGRILLGYTSPPSRFSWALPVSTTREDGSGVIARLSTTSRAGKTVFHTIISRHSAPITRPYLRIADPSDFVSFRLPGLSLFER